MEAENASIHNDLKNATISDEESKRLGNLMKERLRALKEQVCTSQDLAKKASEDLKQASKTLEATKTQMNVTETAKESLLEELGHWKGKYNKERQKSKTLQNKIIDLQGNIRVFCRVRPLTGEEEKDLLMHQDDPALLHTHDNILYLDDGMISFYGTTFKYDHIFAPNAVQDVVFSEVAPAIVSVLNGSNVCVFAYG